MKTKKEITITGALALACLAAASCSKHDAPPAPATSTTPPKPNVIFILVDDMGYGDLSCYGNTLASTPNIDRLAADGIQFNQFYVNSPVCSPSRVAITTGRSPSRYGVYTYFNDHKTNSNLGMPDYLAPDAPTMARLFKANGYATAHIGKWHMGGGRDVGDAPLITDMGNDFSLTSFEGLGDRLLSNGENLSKESAKLGKGKMTWVEPRVRTAIYVDTLLDFIDRNKNTGKPFFVNLWLNDVHDPYKPAPGWEKYAAVTDNIENQKFFAVLETMDHDLGRLFAKLDEWRLRDNTLIVLLSDNGPTDWPSYYKNGGKPPCSAGDLLGRKWSLYEGGIRVPFIIRWPGKVPAGKVDNTTILSSLDFMPTFAAMLALKLPDGYISDGEDMSAALQGRPRPRAKDVFWYYNNRPLPGNPANWTPEYAVRSGDWKLLCNEDGTETHLFNITQDHRETQDLARQKPALTAALLEKVRLWKNEAFPPGAPPKLPDNRQNTGKTNTP